MTPNSPRKMLPKKPKRGRKRRSYRRNATQSWARASNSCWLLPSRASANAQFLRISRDGRGGSGIVAMAMGAKNSAIVAAFAVEDSII